jgi:hypothetical protein
MLAVSLELLVITLALLGWGEWVGWRLSEFRIPALAVQSLFGMYVFALVGQTSSLLGGYAYYAGVALLICGVALFLLVGVINSSWRTWRDTILFVMLCVVAGLALSQSVLLTYDTGLYHLPFIRWIAEAGSVPGLANLHYRFGFNSTWLTSAALFSNSPDFSHGPFIWSIAVTVLLYGALLAKGLRALRYGQNICGAFCLMSAALMLVLPINVDFRLLMSTDLSTALFVLHAMAAYIASREAGADHGANDELLALVCAVPLAVTSKLSSGPLVLLPMLLLPSLAWGKSRVFIGVALLLPMAWMAQNLVLSGCLAYPVVQTCFDLPWAIDPGKAQREIAWVTAWARVPWHEPSDSIFAGYAWLQSWLSTHWALLTMLVKIIGLGAALTFFSVMLRPRSAGISVVAWPMVVATLGLVFWFLAAPDPRFGAGFIVALPALALALPLRQFSGWLTGLLLIGFLWYGNVLKNFLEAYGKGYSLARQIELPQPAVSPHKTAQGLSVWVPDYRDQCWLVVRPCTPPGDFNESLARRTFWLREGFTMVR